MSDSTDEDHISQLFFGLCCTVDKAEPCGAGVKTEEEVLFMAEAQRRTWSQCVCISVCVCVHVSVFVFVSWGVLKGDIRKHVVLATTAPVAF